MDNLEIESLINSMNNKVEPSANISDDLQMLFNDSVASEQNNINALQQNPMNILTNQISNNIQPHHVNSHLMTAQQYFNQYKINKPTEPAESVSSNDYVNISQLIQHQEPKSFVNLQQSQINQPSTTNTPIQRDHVNKKRVKHSDNLNVVTTISNTKAHIMFNVFGYGMPSSTFYFIIVMIIIAVILYYMTAPIKSKIKDEQKND